MGGGFLYILLELLECGVNDLNAERIRNQELGAREMGFGGAFVDDVFVLFSIAFTSALW